MRVAIPERYPRAGPPPSEALTHLLEMRHAMGITRIADITGLDRIGIPVVQVVRPFSLSNSVSQGKGSDLSSAALSAILESAESCFAERIQTFETTVASAKALNISADLFRNHLRDDAAADWYARDTAWVAATDLLSGELQWVPLELVHTAYVAPPVQHDGIFAGSTTGLAASLLETDAIVHGILECVERDAIARAYRTHGFLQRSRLDSSTLEHPGLSELLDALHSAHMLVGLWLAVSQVRLPVVWCQLMENGNQAFPILPYAADGSAASFHMDAAVGHAILEAAQTRLAAISGAREDITRASYPKYPDWEQVEAHRRFLTDSMPTIDLRKSKDHNPDLPAPPMEDLLSRVGECGITRILMVRVDTSPVTGLSVVKIVIPELMPLLHD